MLHIIYGDVLAESYHQDRVADVAHRDLIDQAARTSGKRSMIAATIDRLREIATRDRGRTYRRQDAEQAAAALRPSRRSGRPESEPGVRLSSDGVACA